MVERAADHRRLDFSSGQGRLGDGKPGGRTKISAAGGILSKPWPRAVEVELEQSLDAQGSGAEKPVVFTADGHGRERIAEPLADALFRPSGRGSQCRSGP